MENPTGLQNQGRLLHLSHLTIFCPTWGQAGGCTPFHGEKAGLLQQGCAPLVPPRSLLPALLEGLA